MIRIAALVALISFAGCSDTIFVNSIPQGGAVYLDEREVGKTPCSVEEVDGDSRVVVKLAGYHDHRVILKKTTDPLLALCTLGIAGGGVEKSYAVRMNPLDDAPATTPPTAVTPTAPSRVEPAAAPKAVAAPERAQPARSPKFCTQCGAELAERAKFCGDCGASR